MLNWTPKAYGDFSVIASVEEWKNERIQCPIAKHGMLGLL